MAKYTDVIKSKAKRVLIYGPPKVGKSQLASEIANHGYFLDWFDLENGSGVIEKLPREAQERVNLIVLKDTRSYPIAAETLLKVIKGAKQEICAAHGKVACSLCKKSNAPFDVVELSSTPLNRIVVFDSLTQLTNSFIAHITKGQPDDYKLMQDDWGNLGKLMDIFLSHVQQAGYHIICISHETEVEFEDGKNKIVPVAGTRNFSRNVAKYFDDVIYAEVKNKKHLFTSSTTATMNIVSGSRTNVALETMDKPSLLPIFGPCPEIAMVAVEEQVPVEVSSVSSDFAKTAQQVAVNKVTTGLASRLVNK